MELEIAGNIWGVATPPADWFPLQMPEAVEAAAKEARREDGRRLQRSRNGRVGEDANGPGNGIVAVEEDEGQGVAGPIAFSPHPVASMRIADPLADALVRESVGDQVDVTVDQSAHLEAAKPDLGHRQSVGTRGPEERLC